MRHGGVDEPDDPVAAVGFKAKVGGLGEQNGGFPLDQRLGQRVAAGEVLIEPMLTPARRATSLVV
jgi:hypothetical protein